MNPKTGQEALDMSISKWKEIISGYGVDDHSDNCALCAYYNGPHSCENENGICPIKVFGYPGCVNSEYSNWVSHFKLDHSLYLGKYRIICDKCKELAQKELDFLKSLRLDKQEKFFLNIENPGVAIGEDHIFITIVDKEGNRVVGGNLLSISPEGTLYKCKNVNSRYTEVNADRHTRYNNNIPLQLDKYSRIVEE